MENAERHGRQRQEIGRRTQRRHARGGGSLREKGKVGKKDERWNTAGGRIKQRGRSVGGCAEAKKTQDTGERERRYWNIR